MIPDRDVWAAAVLMVKHDAVLEASERADQLLAEGNMAGAEGERKLETEWYLEADHATAVFDTERELRGVLVLLRYFKQKSAEFSGL